MVRNSTYSVSVIRFCCITFLDFTVFNIEVHGWVTQDFLTLIGFYAGMIKSYTFILYLLRLIR